MKNLNNNLISGYPVCTSSLLASEYQTCFGVFWLNGGIMKYRILNLMTGEKWDGIAKNAKEAYLNITISKGDTTVLNYGSNYRLISVKEW